MLSIEENDRFRLQGPKVAISISSDWGQDVVKSVTEKSGATPVVVSSLSDIVSVFDICVGAVVDLAPWDRFVIDEFAEIRTQVPQKQFVVYVPKDKQHLVTDLRDLDLSVRCCVQDPSPGALAGLESAVSWLVKSGASNRVISMVVNGLGRPVGATTVQFLWWALGISGGKCPAPVAAAAKEFKLSTRTLGRRLQRDGLPPPKELLGWITLITIALKAEATGIKLGRAAAMFQLKPMDLFVLKRRLLNKDLQVLVRQSRAPLGLILDAFSRRCLGLRSPDGGDFQLN